MKSLDNQNRILTNTLVALAVVSQAGAVIGPTVAGRVDPRAPTAIGSKFQDSMMREYSDEQMYRDENGALVPVPERERARMREQRHLREQDSRAHNQMMRDQESENRSDDDLDSD